MKNITGKTCNYTCFARFPVNAGLFKGFVTLMDLFLFILDLFGIKGEEILVQY